MTFEDAVKVIPEVAHAYRRGLQALRAEHREKLTTSSPRALGGSIDLDEALAVANGTQYALTGGLYSRSPANIRKVRRQFRVGNLYINRKITGALVHRQPFGGFKLSGIGSKAGGPD